MTETITSPRNPRLKELRRLADRKHRERAGRFAAEGEDLLAEAARHGWQAEEVFRVPGLELPAGLGGEVFDTAPEALAAASALGSGSRAIGVFGERWAEPPAAGRAVYLHAVGDPGNVGAAVRSVHALLDATVVLGPGCADPYGPRAVRATMGSIFGQPLVRSGWEQLPRPLVALVPRAGEPVWGLEPGPDLTLCLGSEREGLPPALAAAAEAVVHIPLRPGGAESLNVAMACTVACAALARHTLPPSDG